jgi:hypothetical protein
MSPAERLDIIAYDGYRAGLVGAPCDAPADHEIDIAAWERGWCVGMNERQALESTRAQAALLGVQL